MNNEKKEISDLWRALQPVSAAHKSMAADITEFLEHHEWALALEHMADLAAEMQKPACTKKAKMLLKKLESRQSNRETL